jgi:hypothetical protein
MWTDWVLHGYEEQLPVHLPAIDQAMPDGGTVKPFERRTRCLQKKRRNEDGFLVKLRYYRREIGTGLLLLFSKIYLSISRKIN